MAVSRHEYSGGLRGWIFREFAIIKRGGAGSDDYDVAWRPTYVDANTYGNKTVGLIAGTIACRYATDNESGNSLGYTIAIAATVNEDNTH